ncbi:LysR family transcriptional regulator [Sediminimonas sp.]|uniref:LysR family transcriptional regulator n=1 Tax=Sediminimonas sp. TaxID=2823379 RepID=UPI0025CCD5B9|nr:LysR family transcriptional regulator [Sediminimonas sp.]
MDNRLSALDWSLVQAFLAVAEAGSLSGAARRLGRSQPTLGRQIRQIEAKLGVALFTRHPRGLALAEAGQALLPAARRMHDASADIALTAAGRDRALAGTVRITASEVMAHHVLPPVIARIRQALPRVSVELVASDTSENLLYRDADIAVRMYRPQQLDIVARQIGEMPIGIYAAHDYLARSGAPGSLDDFTAHDLVGYDRSDLIVRAMRDMGWPATRDWFATRCDNQLVYWNLICAGCGIGFAPCIVGEAEPRVQRLLPGLALPALPVWLAAPQTTRHSPRIARVWEMLAGHLDAVLS